MLYFSVFSGRSTTVTILLTHFCAVCAFQVCWCDAPCAEFVPELPVDWFATLPVVPASGVCRRLHSRVGTIYTGVIRCGLARLECCGIGFCRWFVLSVCATVSRSVASLRAHDRTPKQNCHDNQEHQHDRYRNHNFFVFQKKFFALFIQKPSSIIIKLIIAQNKKEIN